MRMAPRKPGESRKMKPRHSLNRSTQVNERSIHSLKKRALRRTKTLLRDPETQEAIPPSRFSVLLSKVRAPFTRVYWEDALEPSDGETLVDGKLLSYAYLEAGVIEMLGA